MYDKKNLFDDMVRPAIEQIIQLCALHRIPCFMSFCVKDDGKTSTYANYMNSSVSNGICLTDDQIMKHINVCNGFSTIPSFEKSDFNMFDDIPNDLDPADETSVKE